MSLRNMFADFTTQGMHPDANMLIAMRVQDITPEYIRELHAAGLNPDQNHLIALKVQGADGEYYREPERSRDSIPTSTISSR